MKTPKSQKPKLTDAERYKHFVEVAKKVSASEDVVDFDKVSKTILRSPKNQKNAKEY